MTNTLLTVCICTYNRPELLRECLASLVNQKTELHEFDIVVIDNKPGGATHDVVRSYGEKYPSVKYVAEFREGLSFARNRGWQEAHSPYVAYLDDDAQAYPGWIPSIIDFIGRHPDVGVFGGPYDSYYLSTPPAWFPPEYGSWNLGSEERPIDSEKEWLNGTNIIFSKEVLNRYNGFDVSLGMMGTRVSYGEETSLLHKAAKDGMDVYYVPDIKVKHLVSPDKMNLKWLLASVYAVGRCSHATMGQNKKLRSSLLRCALSFRHLLGLMHNHGKIPFKRRVYYCLYPVMAELGAVSEVLSTQNHPKDS